MFAAVAFAAARLRDRCRRAGIALLLGTSRRLHTLAAPEPDLLAEPRPPERLDRALLEGASCAIAVKVPELGNA